VSIATAERGTRTVVVKMGGSVLVDLPAYHRYAALLGDRVDREPGIRFVVVVSAQFGETDTLLSLARGIVADPDAAALDLLWSTGEIRSAATLVLCLHRNGARAVALNVHQTGIRHLPARAGSHAIAGGSHAIRVNPRPIRRALGHHDVVVVPGFLACGRDGAVVSLGRGGSDLSAVAIAAALEADRCELLKDVPGYFTADPHRDAHAEHLPAITYAQALAMAREGCDLVQPDALDTAQRGGVMLVIAAAGDARYTIVGDDRQPHVTLRTKSNAAARELPRSVTSISRAEL
jgi:aspartate kinase